MTLTLDEVRQVQFHESRRRGYEVTDVDLFVDRVEASFEQLIEENDALKRELEALKQAKSGASDPRSAAQGSSSAAKPAEASRSVLDDTAAQPAVRPGSQDPAADATPSQGASAQGSQDQDEQKIVVTTSAQASPAVIRLVQMATEQAETLVNEAEAQAASTRDSANTEASQTIEKAQREARESDSDASARAERIETEARVNADKVRGDAQNRADNLDSELEERRAELFSELDSERDALVDAVAQLRQFEQSYRANATAQLQGQLEAVRTGQFEPEQAPALANSPRLGSGAQDGSETPRLDALLGDRDEA